MNEKPNEHLVNALVQWSDERTRLEREYAVSLFQGRHDESEALLNRIAELNMAIRVVGAGLRAFSVPRQRTKPLCVTHDIMVRKNRGGRR